MTRSFPFALMAAASLASGGAAIASASPQAVPRVAATHAVTAQHTTTKVGGKPTAARVTTATRTTTTGPAASGRTVTTKTATGRAVTYDCTKAGNKAKAACKR